MRSRPATTCFPPTVLLVMAAALCGGAVASPAGGGVLLPGSPLRAADLAAGRDSVATLLSCLQDAAKQLQKLHEHRMPTAAAVALGGARIDRHGVAGRVAAENRILEPRPRRLGLHHLDLPPPNVFA